MHFSALLAVILTLFSFSSLLKNFRISTIEHWLDTKAITVISTFLVVRVRTSHSAVFLDK